MGDIEKGECEVCKIPDQQLHRKYYHYDLKCECCRKQHFECVRYCSSCKPSPPLRISASVQSEEEKENDG